MSFKVKVKWGTQTLDLAIQPSDGLALLGELQKLTGVPVERQKVMCKELWKGTLKEDTALAGLPGWKDGLLLGLMGTASSGVPAAPETKTVFVEDLSTFEKQKVAAVDPPGLGNLGNTCYLNATVQCLRAVPELRASLDAAPLGAASADVSERMVLAMRNLMREMDGSDTHVTPYQFVQTMRLTYPEMAKQGPQGGFAQQDADEFFGLLMNDLSRKLTRAGPGVAFGPEKDAISALFGVELSTKLKCIESEAEPVSEGADVCKRLQCNIRTETMTIEEGLKLGLEAEIEKQAQTLGRNALFKQTRRVRRLPKYLVVQENRFYWKRNADGQGGVACKILKQVKFAPTLDVFDLCDDKLKEVLKGPRDQYLRERMGREKKPAAGEGASSSSSKDAKAAPAAPGTKDKPADKDQDAEMADADEELKAALKLSMEEGAAAAKAAVVPAAPAGSAGIGLPVNFRGVYELFALVTHKGRASDSGHYVGWVKAKGEDQWVCFDDEQASACKTDDILLLSGGGDRDMCYLCFYRAKE